MGLTMARYKGQMALYEAMQKSRLKPGNVVLPMDSRPRPETKSQSEAMVESEVKPEPEARVESEVELEPQAAATEVQTADAAVVDAASTAAAVEEQTPAASAVRWQRPRRIQLNAGQLELTIPYPIVGAIILALILIILAAYRLGQAGVHAP
jgi:hypothetical protein